VTTKGRDLLPALSALRHMPHHRSDRLGQVVLLSPTRKRGALLGDETMADVMIAGMAHELIAALFLAWRRLLTTLVRGVGCAWVQMSRAGEHWAAGWHTVHAYLTDTDTAWADNPPTHLTAAAVFGLRAFLAGLLISVGLALGTGSRLPEAALAALIEFLWATARLSIVLLVLPSESTRSRVLVAFTAGLAPYVLGLTPLLRLVSLWLSAVLTSRGLLGADITPPLVRSAIRWAFGGQAVVVIGGLAIRGAIALLGAI